jgi:hypothetical protein
VAARRLAQVCGEEDPKLLRAEAGRGEKLRELFHAPRDDAQLLLQLSRRSLFGSLAGVEFARRQLKQVAHGRVSVLPHERDRAVVEDRDDARAARMPHDLSHVNQLALPHGVAQEVNQLARVKLLARENFGLLLVRRIHCYKVSGEL